MPIRGDIAPPSERFWAKVEKSADPDGCWLWVGYVHSTGYGHFFDGTWLRPRVGRYVKAHRWSYEEAHGPIPPGALVCHHCDTPRCVRPDHLFLGSNADNMADMKSKGRGRGYSQPGIVNPRAKLTEDDVREIRRLRAETSLLQRDIAMRFGVTQMIVSKIERGLLWGHVR